MALSDSQYKSKRIEILLSLTSEWSAYFLDTCLIIIWL